MISTNKKAWFFILVTFLFSVPFYYILAKAGWVGFHGGIYVMGLMFSPSFAAFFLTLFYKDKKLNRSLKKSPLKYLKWAFVIPLIYSFAGFFVALFFNLIEISSFLKSERIVPILTLGLVQHLVFAAGEELGWRGYLFPTLLEKNKSFRKTVWITGLIWIMWHFPLLFLTDYSPNQHFYLGVLNFSAMTLGLNALISWLRLKSGSIWPCVLLHASHNFFVMLLFKEITSVSKTGYYFVGEFGIGMGILGLGFLIWFAYIKNPK